MWGFELLDVVIGMIFVYLLLSLFCSAMNELVEGVMKNRAKDLEEGLRELLNDKTGSGLVKKLYDHGLINGLFKGTYDPAGSKKNLPSYIPSGDFAMALMDIACADARPVAPAAAAAPAPASGSAAAMRSVRASVASMPNDSVRQALTAITDSAGDNIDEVRAGIEAWFNGSMDRVSGWYKRRTQIIILVLGVCIAVIMNVNSLTLANDLWTHKAQRDVLVSSAQGYSQSAAPSAPDLQSRVDAIAKYDLPIGWDDAARQNVKHVSAIFVLRSVVGWLLTALAVSLGAPFWFDMLNKFIVIRSTVKPREKSVEEPSKH
jgi:hypothetical protein